MAIFSARQQFAPIQSIQQMYSVYVNEHSQCFRFVASKSKQEGQTMIVKWKGLLIWFSNELVNNFLSSFRFGIRHRLLGSWQELLLLIHSTFHPPNLRARLSIRTSGKTIDGKLYCHCIPDQLQILRLVLSLGTPEHPSSSSLMLP